MIREKSLVVYKNRPALVTEVGEKISITVMDGEAVRVREKDIEVLHPGPASLADLDKEAFVGDIRSAWELLEGSEVALKELAELVYGAYTVQSAWAAYALFKDGLYFTGNLDAIHGRSVAEVSAAERKRADRQRESEARDAFLERLKAGAIHFPQDDDAELRRYFQEVESLGYGHTDKSRTLKELGKQETPVEAHHLLLATGYWTPFVNPHPARFGVSAVSAKTPIPPPPPDEARVDLTHLSSFAVDNAWSDDPDDAISIEGNTLYVHVADPAAAIAPNSEADREARGRGATLYLPEGASRMMSAEALPYFALGLAETSPALSFVLTLNDDGSIADTDIVRSRVTVTRLTYTEADALLGEESSRGADITRLFALAERNVERRRNAGAVFMDFPEMHITVAEGQVSVTPLESYRSADMVRECMLLAGEAAAEWALRRRLPFPYVCQETGELPDEPLTGLAGSYQMRRCMRPRSLSAKPGLHWGLGLEAYTQVTSPLRRYTDLLAHEQIRALLCDKPPLSEDELLLHLAAGEAAASATVHAERASRAHWIAVYLADKIGSAWQGVVVDVRGARSLVMLPALGIETLVAIRKEPQPNDEIPLTLSRVKIPECELTFSPAREG
ncbi:MAG: RNB domain-containing ribonuclease [Treponema sp.]|jgi:exoribonuclease-2|nr:RNB domain-containing ribonuclease [Treponema sp.]